MAKETVSGIERLWRPCSEGEEQLFTAQFRRLAMREAVDKDLVQPLFH